MKTIILLAILLLPGLAGAQRREIRIQPGGSTGSMHLGAVRDSTRQWRYRNGKISLPGDTTLPAPPNNRMPNALGVPGAPNTYKGHNGQGFDLYQSPVDHMTILMPDSANKALLKMTPSAPAKRKIMPVRIIPLVKPGGAG